MGLVLRHRHGPSRRGRFRACLEWSTFRSMAVSRGFTAPAVVEWTCCPVLRGRALRGSLFELLLVRGALERERAYSSAG